MRCVLLGAVIGSVSGGGMLRGFRVWCVGIGSAWRGCVRRERVANTGLRNRNFSAVLREAPYNRALVRVLRCFFGCLRSGGTFAETLAKKCRFHFFRSRNIEKRFVNLSIIHEKQMRKTLFFVLLASFALPVAGQQIQVTPEMLQQAKNMGLTDTQIDRAVNNPPADTSFGRESGLRVVSPEQPPKPADAPKNPAEQVFGSEVFGLQRLSFEPNFNMPTPQGYVLSAGDQLLIELWGNSEASYTRTVSPDGIISLPSVGTVFLSGKTIEQARSIIQEKLSTVYSEIETGGIHLRVSLGQIRSIRVNIAGEASAPGTYTLPSLATLFNALYMAGGVNPIGSLRVINVYRNNKRIASLDVYDYILNGKYEANITLEDNDMVIVEPYRSHVRIQGGVKRERIFELKEGETLEDLLRYSGGFTGQAYMRNVSVNRVATGDFRRIYTVEQKDFPAFALQDGDTVVVGSVIERFANRVAVRGGVWRPGDYQLDESAATVRALIDKAGGLQDQAYFERAILRRKNPDNTYRMIAIDLSDILSDGGQDIALEKDDDLYIPLKSSLHQAYFVTVRGEVNGISEQDREELLARNVLAVQSGGTYVSPSETLQKGLQLTFMDGMSVADAILLAGGFRESASQVQISVVRCKKDPLTTVFDDVPAEEFQVTLKDGLAFDQQGREFYLQPFDEIIVRRSPGYVSQEFVSISGEAVFCGGYNLTKNMRISDLLERAGGMTPYAYMKGAQLRRRFSPDDLAKLEAKARMLEAADGRDSLSASETIEVPKYYLVGINLQQAVKNRGGNFDVILQEGDELVIPAYTDVVKISGGVVYPNAVTFEKGKSLKKYIFNAGGYAQNARRKAYVIYANGQVETVRGFLFRRYPTIEPGCEIIVPIKVPRQGLGLAGVMGLATSATSIAALINSMIK